MPTLRENIQSALQALASGPLRSPAISLLQILGYESDRTLILDGSKPSAFLDLVASQSGQTRFDETKALFSDWKSADILFQLSDADISRERSLFKDTTVQTSLLHSYIFFAIELKGKDYARGKLTGIARQINRVFPMPVMLIIRHGDASGAPVLSIAVINRRRNKVHTEKDVLEKVTLIRDISLNTPHRGHLDILQSFAFSELEHPKKLPIADFDSLHAAWEQIFNVELLNTRFYKELANWYFWALPQVEFPNDTKKDSEEKHQASSLIRLLTRLIFCWFLKEKNLIPEKLFHPTDLANILKGFDPESETSSTYYLAILQNLFFASLNQRMGKDGKGQPYRAFATDEGFQKNRATYDVNNLYRYEGLFRGDPDAALAQFADIPFLNGGLFECLDRTEDGTDKKRYLDGFSRNAKKRPHVPDRLFFDSGETADLSTAYGDTKHKAEKVTGLITILNRYKFTIVENTPIDQEIALDPELLGKVFENLLASYNEETKSTARKQTGSFYTPRPIVDYMVDESLKAHLSRALVEKARMKEPDARAGLDLLFAYTEKEHAFTPAEVATLITAIDALKILDPACGSGAFPMGVLHKLVYILGKLDPDNDRWKQTQLAKLDSAPMREELERAFSDNNDDYGRKLYLIENCLYGVDIQPIAIQITKLRFFISLVCDQKTNRDKAKNHGIRPLPNLETKFVAANTLIGLPDDESDLFADQRIEPIQNQIRLAYHSHFSIQKREDKLRLQKKVTDYRKQILAICLENVNEARRGIQTQIDRETDFIEKQHRAVEAATTYAALAVEVRNDISRRQRKISVLQSALARNSQLAKKAIHIAEWNPFDPQAGADFFDPYWMFGFATGKTTRRAALTLGGEFSALLEGELTPRVETESGFDITIGNPPYVRADEQSEVNQTQRQAILASNQYETLWEKWDLFVPFLERSYKLLRPHGVSTMIVSDAFCHSKYAQKAQSWFLQNARILRLDFCGDVKIFEAAVHNVITCFQKAKGAEWKPERRLHRETFGEVTELPTDEQANLTHRVFFPEDAPTEAFDCKSVLLGAVCYISVGMVVHADEKVAKGAFELDDLVADSQDAQHPRRFVEGKHLARWFSSETKWLEWGTARAPHMFRRKTFPELYEATEKVFIHRTGGEGLRSCYDDQKTLCNHTVIVSLPWSSLKGVRNKSIKKAARYRGEKPPRPDLPKREELETTSRRFAVKYLLGVMNSGSARYFLRANRRSNTDLYPDDWKRLPIPDVTAAQQKPIVALVDQILTLKRANPAADIRALETQLDTAVAALYGLTPEEIAIVEGTAK